MATFYNKLFNNTQQEIPQLTGVVGSGIAMLDACLVNGFNTRSNITIAVTTNVATVTVPAKSITITNYIGANSTTVTGTVASTFGLYVNDSITISGASGTEQTKLNGTWVIASIASATTFTFVVSSSVATGTLTTTLGTTVKNNHGFLIDDIVTISGANESVFNSDFKITNVTSSTFTFNLTTAITDATGTISVKITPLGWEKTYSGTNKAVYRSLDNTGTRLYLRVDDTNAQYMTVNMYETMTNVDTGTGASTVYWKKSSTSDTTARAWQLIGNGKVFYWFIDWNAATAPLQPNGYAFGDFITAKAGDAYNCMIIGHTSSAPTGTFNVDSFYYNRGVSNNLGQYITRSFSQLGTSVSFFKESATNTTTMGYGGSIIFPNQTDNGIHLTPLYIIESATLAYRGRMAGLLCPFETTNGVFPALNKTVVINGKTYVAIRIVSTAANLYGNCFFPLDDEWV